MVDRPPDIFIRKHAISKRPVPLTVYRQRDPHPTRVGATESLFDVFAQHEKQITAQADSLFHVQNTKARLTSLYNVDSLDAFGSFSDNEIAAAGALIDYAMRTQKGQLLHIRALTAFKRMARWISMALHAVIWKSPKR